MGDFAFRPLTTDERGRLTDALRRNADDGAALLTSRLDTGFAGAAAGLPDDDEVITAIRSVPCHYAEGHTLPRSGEAPLSFAGELLAESDGERLAGQERSRWHDVAVYRTAGGHYVVGVRYRTRWQGEVGHDLAQAVERPEAVAEVLRDYDPTAHVAGYPPGDAYAERQARLFADLRARYEAQVSEVLAAATEFAETVE